MGINGVNGNENGGKPPIPISPFPSPLKGGGREWGEKWGGSAGFQIGDGEGKLFYVRRLTGNAGLRKTLLQARRHDMQNRTIADMTAQLIRVEEHARDTRFDSQARTMWRKVAANLRRNIAAAA